ncbi:hypothetical protein BH11BAC2_BH11BAC2_07010 [soil metagenome]
MSKKHSEEIFMFTKHPKRTFIEPSIKDLVHRLSTFPVLTLPFVFTIISIVLSGSKFEYVSWIILGIGFLTVGLSHGALDHLTTTKINCKKQLFTFVTNYLVKSTLLGVLWLLFPDLALLIFIAYSAWHFGQADFKEWKLKQGWQSLLWGTTVLMTILLFHFDELNNIIQQIPNLKIAVFIRKVSPSQLVIIKIAVISCGIFLAGINKSKFIIYTLTYLLLSSFLPILVSFGIYFIGQHSIQGWRHLSKGLNESSSDLWLKSLPFSLGGALIILSLILIPGLNSIGMFFIILSCLSLPHVFSMHHFYTLKRPE